MIWKNIEIHNIGELTVDETGSATWLRVPKAVHEAQETDQGKQMSMGSTGVELRFVMNSPSVTIRLQSLSDENVVTTQQLYYGGLQGGWDAHELNGYISTEPCDLVIKRPENGEML